MGFVLAKSSIVRRIQFSEIVRARWAKNIKKLGARNTAASQIKNLASAKHRFDSYAVPLKRGVVFWHALLRTGQELQDERKAERDGKDAAAWLEMVDVESCLTLGMLADSSEEADGFLYGGSVCELVWKDMFVCGVTICSN